MPLCKNNCLLYFTSVYEVSSCVCALLLIKCCPTYHNLHHTIQISHIEDWGWFILLGSLLNNTNINNLLILKAIINKVRSNSFRPVTPPLDYSSYIDSFGF